MEKNLLLNISIDKIKLWSIRKKDILYDGNDLAFAILDQLIITRLLTSTQRRLLNRYNENTINKMYYGKINFSESR